MRPVPCLFPSLVSVAALLLGGCSLFVDLDELGGAPPADGRAGGGSPADATDVAPQAPSEASPDTSTETGGETQAPTPLPPSETATTWTLSVRNPGSAPLLSGYTARLDAALFTAQGFKPDLSDLRLGREGTELDRVVEVGAEGVATGVWLALKTDVPAGGSSTYTVVRATASPARSDGRLVFPLYDDFAGAAVSTATWRVSGAPVVANGTLTLRKGQAGEGLATGSGSDLVPAQAALEVRARVTDPASAAGTNGQQSLHYWFGFQREGDFTAAKPWVLWVGRGANVVTHEVYTQAGVCSTASTECRGAGVAQSAAFRTYRIERRATRTVFFLDGQERGGVDVPVGGDMAVMMRNWLVTSDVEIDWVRARALVEREPDVTLAVNAAAPR